MLGVNLVPHKTLHRKIHTRGKQLLSLRGEKTEHLQMMTDTGFPLNPDLLHKAAQDNTPTRPREG